MSLHVYHLIKHSKMQSLNYHWHCLHKLYVITCQHYNHTGGLFEHDPSLLKKYHHTSWVGWKILLSPVNAHWAVCYAANIEKRILTDSDLNPKPHHWKGEVLGSSHYWLIFIFHAQWALIGDSKFSIISYSKVYMNSLQAILQA